MLGLYVMDLAGVVAFGLGAVRRPNPKYRDQGEMMPELLGFVIVAGVWRPIKEHAQIGLEVKPSRLACSVWENFCWHGHGFSRRPA